MNESSEDSIDALLRRQFEGPVADDGFSDRVMRQLPSPRRRIAWPLWLGVSVGSVACLVCLTRAPLLISGWRDWHAGDFSPAVMGMWLAILSVALLALSWGLVESRNR